MSRLPRDVLEKRVKLLEDAIIDHRSQKADDRCIEDDDSLYKALGDGIKCDRDVGSKEAMLKNCARFIENRCTKGGWISYQELEEKVSYWEARYQTLVESGREAHRLHIDIKEDFYEVLDVLRGLNDNCRIGECRPNCDDCDIARLNFRDVLVKFKDRW